MPFTECEKMAISHIFRLGIIIFLHTTSWSLETLMFSTVLMSTRLKRKKNFWPIFDVPSPDL